ncbi:MAG: hypothetical protein KDC95_02225 [Planctomycetes bacterium]|nr:hypothetical protein [Planctomycetota bacterium]
MNMQTARVIKHEPRVDVFVVDGVCVKEYRVPWYLRWREFCRRSRARREYDNIDAMHRCGLPTIEALDWVEARRMGFTTASTLHTRYLESTETMRQRLANPGGDDPRLARSVGTALRQIHDAGFVCNSASPRNWLLRIGDDTSTEMPVLCDLPFVHRRSRSVVGTREAMVDLYAAALGESRRRETTADWRRHFLAGYCLDDEDRMESLRTIGEGWTRRRFRFERDFGIAKAHVRRLFSWMFRRTGSPA